MSDTKHNILSSSTVSHISSSSSTTHTTSSSNVNDIKHTPESSVLTIMGPEQSSTAMPSPEQSSTAMPSPEQSSTAMPSPGKISSETLTSLGGQVIGSTSCSNGNKMPISEHISTSMASPEHTTAMASPEQSSTGPEEKIPRVVGNVKVDMETKDVSNDRGVISDVKNIISTAKETRSKIIISTRYGPYLSSITKKFGWTCKRCKYFVDSQVNGVLTAREVCPSCRQPRNVSWICKHCTFVNTCVDPQCKMCMKINSDVDYRGVIPKNIDGDKSSSIIGDNKISMSNIGDKLASTNTGDKLAVINTGDKLAGTNAGNHLKRTTCDEHILTQPSIEKSTSIIKKAKTEKDNMNTKLIGKSDLISSTISSTSITPSSKCFAIPATPLNPSQRSKDIANPKKDTFQITSSDITPPISSTTINPLLGAAMTQLIERTSEVVSLRGITPFNAINSLDITPPKEVVSLRGITPFNAITSLDIIPCGGDKCVPDQSSTAVLNPKLYSGGVANPERDKVTEERSTAAEEILIMRELKMREENKKLQHVKDTSVSLINVLSRSLKSLAPLVGQLKYKLPGYAHESSRLYPPWPSTQKPSLAIINDQVFRFGKGMPVNDCLIYKFTSSYYDIEPILDGVEWNIVHKNHRSAVANEVVGQISSCIVKYGANMRDLGNIVFCEACSNTNFNSGPAKSSNFNYDSGGILRCYSLGFKDKIIFVENRGRLVPVNLVHQCIER